MRHRPRTSIPWFRRRRIPFGTVYLMQARDTPRLFKVGFTKRRTKDRRGELNRVARDDMAIVYTVSLPWARSCETLVLGRLRWNPFRRGDTRGTEWFWLGKRESIEAIVRKIDRAARDTRRMARWRWSWPTGAEIREFRAHEKGGPVHG
ncbi:GIY-YIG nuclease family protein [Yoonia sp. SS1-5]|uniref:GIY-YIG nuclease family protein n=1 Tax=Yoonia rhodophyticola TaxID=3137370 RepID=A0AAN0MIN5_9RHOB